MSFGDINSGATPQPGGVVYRKDADADEVLSPQEETAQATQDALKGEGAFANVKAGIKDEVAVTKPVVEADDAKASGGSSAGQGDPDSDGDGTDSPIEGGNARQPKSEGEDDDQPAKSATKKEWADYAGLSEEEADSMTKDEIVEKYGK